MAARGRRTANINLELKVLRERAERAEAALLAASAKLRSFMEAASDGFLVLDSNLRVVDVTHRDLASLGISPATIIGRPLDELSPGFRIEGRLEQFREVVRTGKGFFVEDFSPAWPPAWQNKRVSQKVFRIGDEVGVVITDITERKQAEAELRRSEALYRLLAENVDDVIWTVDRAGRLEYVSPSVKRLLGYDPSDVRGLPALKFVPAADRRDLLLSLRRHFDDERAAPSAREPFSVDLRLLRKDGSSVWTESVLSGIQEIHQDSKRIVGVTRDISERKQAQELFQTLADNSPVGVYISRRGRLVFANRQFMEYSKRSPHDLMNLETISFVLPEDRVTARRSAIAMLKGESQSPYTFRYLTSDGQVRWAMERVASVILYGERAILGCLMDITKAKQDEEALRRSGHELRLLSLRILEVQDAERSYIARELHDQIGQQVFAIKMELGRLVEHPPEMSALQGRLSCILSLIDRLQFTCRAIAVGLTPSPYEKLGLTSALQLYAEEFERRTGISCPVSTAASDIPLSAATCVVIHRVLQEALLNVWRHAKAKQVNVRLSQIDDSIVLEVQDDGVGFNLDETRDPALLGLRGMRERALLLGGSVDIDSCPGQGTIVRLRLPLTEPMDEPMGTPLR